jgi:hypothetical protein
VVEQDSSRKRFLIVAFRTILSEISLVYIVQSMAVMALHRCLALFHLPGVAAIAGTLSVGTPKREAGFLGVIEF